MLVLEDGQIAWGDCAAVQYSGAGGRDPLFLAEDFIPLIETYIKPVLVGREADSFRTLCREMEAVSINGRRLHTAVRYGLSQAILDAVAKSTGRLMCEVVADEYDCSVSDTPIPIFTQSGDDRYSNADKMIIKGAQVLPHGLINNVEEKLGLQGKNWPDSVVLAAGPDLVQAAGPPIIRRFCTLTYRYHRRPVWESQLLRHGRLPGRLEELAKPLLHLRIEYPMDCDCDRQKSARGPGRPDCRAGPAWNSGRAGGGRVVQYPGRHQAFADHKAGHMVQIKTPDLGSIHNTVRPFCTARPKASAHTKAVLATKRTAAPRFASIAPWLPSRNRSWPSRVWA